MTTGRNAVARTAPTRALIGGAAWHPAHTTTSHTDHRMAVACMPIYEGGVSLTLRRGYGPAQFEPHPSPPGQDTTGTALPDIFDEVEEDLRAERARSFGRRFAGLFVAALLLVLAGTGAYVWYTQQSQSRAEVVAQNFISASKQADKAALPLGGLDKQLADEAATRFQTIAATGPAGYAVLARLRLAALQWQLGREPAAIATWLSVSNDASAPKLLRDLATVVSAQHQVDSADPIILKQTVEALTAQDNPWRPMAEQVIALIDLRMGKTRDAEALMTRLIADPMAPEGIRQMVADLLAALPPSPNPAPDAAPKPPALPTPASPTPASAKPASHG